MDIPLLYLEIISQKYLTIKPYASFHFLQRYNIKKKKRLTRWPKKATNFYEFYLQQVFLHIF